MKDFTVILYDDFKKCIEKIAPEAKKTDYVYHYTSLETLKKIFENDELWISHASFMNDPQEILFGIKIIKKILDTEQEKYKNVLTIIEINLKDADFFSTPFMGDLPFIFSLSEKKR